MSSHSGSEVRTLNSWLWEDKEPSGWCYKAGSVEGSAGLWSIYQTLAWRAADATYSILFVSSLQTEAVPDLISTRPVTLFVE